MILFHGTNQDFDNIDLSLCAPYKDFGTGFYTTTLFEQAKAMAIRKSKIFGGEPCVISYEAPDNLLELEMVTVKNFPSTSKEWAVFIINNRNRDFTDIHSTACNLDNKYEIVFGPVANDTLTTLIRQYQRGFIDSAILLKEMEYAAPNNQYSFHSQNAISLLKKVGVQWIR
ncbi:MAG: DUF3990 domain-containing protein [Lysinibacillus sp.]